MTTLLLAQPRSYSDLFLQPQPAIAPFHVKRAEAYIEAHLDESVIGTLAAVAGVSAYKRRFGESPSETLRRWR